MRAKAMIVIWTIVLVIGTSIQVGSLSAKPVAETSSTKFQPALIDFAEDPFATETELF